MIDFPNHLLYMAWFLVGVALALALGAYFFARCRSRLPIERLTLFLYPIVVYITISLVAIKVIQIHDNDWNAARLTPAIALLSGAKLYVGPHAPGALMNTIFPPVAYLAYIPAGLFTSAAHAILAGSIISLVLYAAPTLVLSFWPRKDGADSRSLLMGIASLLVLFQAAVTSKTLNHAAFCIHADAPMMAFTGFAAMALYLSQRNKALSLGTCLVSTACASMAIWSELSAAPVILILPVWVLATRGVREALRYSLYLVTALALSALVFRTIFGFASFTFNIIEIPWNNPWIYQGPQFTDGLLLVSTEFFCGAIWFVAALLLALLARSSFTSVGPTVSSAKVRGFRASLVENSWLLFVLIAIEAIPPSLVGRLKVGGYLNNYAPVLYFLTMALLAVLHEWHTTNWRRGPESLNSLLILSLLLLVLSPLTCSENSFEIFKLVRSPSRTEPEIAYEFSKRYPGMAYFPWNPLSNLMGERKLYDFEGELFARELTGYPATALHVRQNLPNQLRYVCFPPHNRGTGGQYERTLKYLPEFRRQVAVHELPGWTCYERDQTSETR